MASEATSANGIYMDCGPGQPFSLQITCTGPSCLTLQSFPGLTCQSTSTNSICNNGVTCSNAPPQQQQQFQASTFVSNFTLTQPPQAVQVMTQQNLDIGGSAIQLNATNTGDVTYSYGDVTVNNNGTSVSGTPISTSTRKSSSSRSHVVSKWALVLLVFMAMFIGQIQAQSLSWGSILSGIPMLNVQFIQGLEPQICSSAIPVIDAAVCGGRLDALGVADIARICLQIVGQAQQPEAALTDPVTAFGFALGNNIACDQIANAFLSGTNDENGRQLCASYVASTTCITSVFTTMFTSNGSTVVSTLSTLSMPSSAASQSGGSVSAAIITGSAAVSSQVSGGSAAPASSATAGGSASQASGSTPVATIKPIAVSTGNATVTGLKHRRHGIPCNDPEI